MEVFTRLAKRLVNNIGLKILSLLLGILIWVIVVGIDNPVKTQIFSSIPVNVENAAVMEDAGKFYEVADSSKTVTVSVRAERSILDQLSRDNFIASINLEEYNEGRVPISVRATRYADKITSITPRNSYAIVAVEDLGRKQFGIEAEISGEVPEGYSVGGSTINNNIVRVSGPESVVNSIDHAAVRVSVQGMTRDIRTESNILLYDSAGQNVDTDDLELSRTETGITVEIWKNKDVPVTYGYTGIPADGFAATGNVSATVNDLTITGDRDDLSEVESIMIPGTAVDISNASGNVTSRVDLSKYIPSGIRIVHEEDALADVTVEIQELSTINVEIPASNITVDNVPAGMTAVVGGIGEVTVISVRGLSKDLSALNPAMITGRIDMNEIAVSQNIGEWTAGAYEAPVTFTYPEGIYSGNSVVAVKVILRPEEAVAADAVFNDGAVSDGQEN